MLNARIIGEAKVNFGVHEWTTLMGSGAEMMRVTDLMGNGGELPWSEGFCTRLVEDGDHLVILAADKIGNIPDTLADWRMETLVGGKKGNRPCGALLAYRMPKEDVRAHGLPHIDEIRAAFQQDARHMLEHAYQTQTPMEAATRAFAPRTLAHTDEAWLRAERAIKEGHSFTPAAGSHAERLVNGARQGLEETKFWHGRRGMIAGAVGLGAVAAGVVAWKLLNREPKEASQRR
jgi:hypothetical protein